MTNIKETAKKAQLLSKSYANFSRRTFLKGALAVGGALALAGCGEAQTEVRTVTVTETKTVTVAEPPTVPGASEIVNLVTKPSVIIPQYTRCEGCNLCMIACSFKHGGNGDMQYSNIQVYGIDIKGGMVDIPILCVKCKDTPCLASCPPKVAAISVDEVTGAVKLDQEKCTVCGNCVEACNERTGCLRFSRDEDAILGSCDMCGGNPECVQICPGDVLQIQPQTLPGEYWARKAWPIAEDVWRTLYR